MNEASARGDAETFRVAETPKVCDILDRQTSPTVGLPATDAWSGMKRLLTSETELDRTRLSVRLAALQRALPIGILLAVLLYELGVEILLHALIPPWLHIALELLIFGFFGAAVTWFSLAWVRQRAREEAEREQVARAHERQLAVITANSADAIITLDNDGVIQSWNRGAELIFGYRPKEVVGRHFRLLVPAEQYTRGELDYLDGEMKERGFIRGYVTKRLTKDGRTISVELTRTLLRDENGNIIGASAILRDVTERERIEEEIRELNRQLEAQVAKRTRELSEANQELRRRQRELEHANAELKQLDQLKSEFVSLVSHELRAPLANISGSLQLLLDDHDRRHIAGHQREILSLANEEVERLTRLVKGILNVSRVEAGQMDFAPQAFDLLYLIERIVSQWKAVDTTHVYVAPHARNLPSVWADRDRVEEVLTNLLENACKYSRDGTEIRVDAQAVDTRMVITICDQGEGIAPEELEMIFAKFHRVERDDARKTYGYGLGLYISRKLIEAMGGELWAESQVGRGSTFSLSIPLAGQQAAPATPNAAAPHPSRAKETPPREANRAAERHPSL